MSKHLRLRRGWRRARRLSTPPVSRATYVPATIAFVASRASPPSRLGAELRPARLAQRCSWVAGGPGGASTVPDVRIIIEEGGGYVVDGDIMLTDGDGRELGLPYDVRLCRCGRSGNQPFCDGTHAAIDFDGTLAN